MGKRPICGAQGTREWGNRLSREVASPGREWGRKAGWGTVVSPTVYTSCCFQLFCVEHTPLPRGETKTQAPALTWLGAWASTSVSEDRGRYSLRNTAGRE